MATGRTAHPITSADSSSSAPSAASAAPFPPSHVPLFRCHHCTLPLSLTDELVSRAFQGATGPAILVRSAWNVREGERETKNLMSGRHVIATIRCSGCDVELGWRYYTSPNSSQKYKEGKYILEKDNAWSVDDAPT
ncbi:hypothetical protein JCM8202_003501 [Rhodotorula sphaerocarpa]